MPSSRSSLRHVFDGLSTHGVKLFVSFNHSYYHVNIYLQQILQELNHVNSSLARTAEGHYRVKLSTRSPEMTSHYSSAQAIVHEIQNVPRSVSVLACQPSLATAGATSAISMLTVVIITPNY